MSQEKTKLSRADRKQIEAAIAKAKNTDKRHKSAQDSIPFQRMFPDGICRVTDYYYSKTVQFQDINYQLNQNEDKTAIFDSWCDFLNYFDSSIHFQLSFVNLAANKDSYAQTIAIPPRADAFNQLRTEYTKMLQTQLARGNNGLVKTKFITFGVEAENLKTAKPRLERIEIDILNNFKRLGVQAEPLNGHDRLKLMHDVLHMDEQEPFRFSWDWLAPSGLSVKDFIAPSSFEFRTGSSFAVGKKYGRASFLQILAPELNDRMLADFLDMESSVIVSMHIQSVDQVKAIKTIKRKITDLDKMKIEEQKKAIRAGYDMDIIPSDLATYGNEAKKLLQELQSRNERMFLLTFIILNTAGSMQQLKNNVFQANSIAQKYNCQLTTLDFRQEEGLMSSLPLGLNEITIQRGLTTSSVAIFVPFTTQELFQTGKEALYCGINALSNNLIMVDRKLLKNPNGLILGTPGSGKSFSAKREIANVFLVTDDDIIICDPEAEYGPLVEHLHGQVIKISPTSTDYINPMDLNLNYSDDENPLSLKSDFILSLCELIVGGKDGLMPVEKTIIDRCVRLVYRNYLNDPRPENMPILGDLYEELRKQDEKEAQYIATALEIYVTGSLNVFNHQTKETTLAQQKQQAIKDAFQEWIWKDPTRRHELVQKYNELFNATRPREYNGQHITFSGMNPEIQLREHQLNAVAHILYGGNTLLAHEVGAGKTFEMVAAAMESKRLGLCHKPMFVVPNHLIEQWASEFLRLYPSANILAVTKKDFEPRNRKKFCARIATGDYDAVIIGHSQFERIPVSKERQERMLQEQIYEIEDGLMELKANNAERFTIKSLEKTKKSLEVKLKKLQDTSRKDDVITFEQLGVDRLYVDEAHAFKNLFLYTKMRNVAGLSTTDAQKSSDMLLKCRYIDEITGNKGIVFATGTPVSNSMTELYTMMRYLQHDMLQRKHLTHFDCWASTFGETATAIELAPEGTGYRARTRFSKFFNLPELMQLFKEAADIKTADQLHLPTPTPIYHNVVAQPTEIQKGMVQELSERAAKVHAGIVDASTDNMLKITSDGRKLGLDQRVINPDLPDEAGSKVNLCVDNIYSVWKDGQADKLTQLVFCDSVAIRCYK